MTVLDAPVEMIPVEQLIEYPGNARRGNLPVIVESIKRNGFYGVVIRQKSTGYILVGNHRTRAAREVGLTHVPVQTVDVDDATAKRMLTVDNRSNDLADTDDAALLAILDGWTDEDLLGTGYDREAMNLLELSVADSLDDLTEPDAVPDLPVTPVSKEGDIWVLGEHRLVCGSCTDPGVLDRLMMGKQADVVWTDPPYGVEYIGKTKNSLTIRNDDRDGLPQLLNDAFAQAIRCSKPGAPMYIAHPAGARSTEFEKAASAQGLLVRQTLIWVKNSMVLGHADYHYKHEPILYGYTPGATGRLGRGGNGWVGDNSQTSVFEYPKPPRSDVHPTMKPVDLVAAMLRNSTPARGTVLDVFGGSGTTLIAAHQLRAKARLVELDPKYCDVICRRFQEFAGIVPILESTGEPQDFTS